MASPAAPAPVSRPSPLSRGSLVGLTTAACLVYGLGAGTRSNFGMLVQPLVAATGLSYDRVSLVMAVAQLASGVAGPLAGALMVSGGLAALPHVSGLVAVMAIMGVLLPGGTGVLAFGVVMGVVSHRMTRAQSTSASGVVTASAGIVGTALSPAIASLLAALGLTGALTVLAVPALAAIPVIVWMCAVGLRGPAVGPDGPDGSAGSGGHDDAEGRSTVVAPERPDAGPAPEELLEAAAPADQDLLPERTELRDLLRRAFHDRGYLIVFTAFFTCGFHMAIIETHLVSQMQHDGMTASGAATASSGRSPRRSRSRRPRAPGSCPSGTERDRRRRRSGRPTATSSCPRVPTQAPRRSRSAAMTGAAPERMRIERSTISRAVTA